MTVSIPSLSDITFYLYDGVDPNVPGDGGPECAAYIPNQRKLVESGVMLILALVIFAKSWRDIDRKSVKVHPYQPGWLNQTLLILLTTTMGVETCYKIISRTVIYLLQPCHVLATLQIILLAAPNAVWSTQLARITMQFLFCSLLALVFPVLNTLHLLGEKNTYYVEHWLILYVVPPFLAYRYNLEKFSDFRYSFLAWGVFIIYMFFFLQPVGYYTEVNLNCMICPAISDPFAGPNYRVYAMFTMPLAIFACGRLTNGIASLFINRFKAAATPAAQAPKQGAKNGKDE